jgi:hypothetical protein
MLEGYEIKSTTHLFGLVALGLSLLAMTMKSILPLRIISAVANFVYVIYGYFLGAPPLVLGGTVAIVIHGYHIHKLARNNQAESKNAEVCRCQTSQSAVK